MMRGICVFVMLVAAHASMRRAAAPARPRPRPPLRIYEGRDDAAGRFPYIVALVQYGAFRMCTGTLISPNWVLTASHCISNPANPTEIQYGNMSLMARDSTTKSKILNKFLHPSFKITVSDKFGVMYINNDIGLVKIEPVHMRAYGNISALDYRATTGRAVECAGYGSTHKPTTADRLRVAIADQRRVLQLGEGVVVLCEDKQFGQFICVAPTCANKQQSMMPGDSGSPLFHDGKVIGVLMGGEPATGTITPIAMFTGISPFLSWINHVMIEDTD